MRMIPVLLSLALLVWVAPVASALPWMIFGMQGTPGALFALGCDSRTIGWGNLSEHGCLYFSAPACSVGSVTVAWVADPGGGPADVPEPSLPQPPKPKPHAKGCGMFGLEVIAFCGYLWRRKCA